MLITQRGIALLDQYSKSDFVIVNDDPNEKYIKFNSHIQLKLLKKGTEGLYLSTKEEDINILGFKEGLNIEQQKKISLHMTANKKEYLYTTFLFEDVPESSSIHIYQTSRIVKKMMDFYEFINKWGVLQVGIPPVPSYDYEYAVDTENELSEKTDHMFEILANLKERIIAEEMSPNLFKSRQETIKDCGLLDLMLRIAQLAENKIKIQYRQKPSHYNERNKKSTIIMLELLKKNAESELHIPQLIAKKHLEKFIKKLYHTIYLCIKDNVSCCEILKNYHAFLNNQIGRNRMEVRKIINESFKHSIDILNETSLKQFSE